MVARILVSILVVAAAGGTVFWLYQQEDPACVICKRPMHHATAAEIELVNGEIIKVCCPRCGLHFQKGREDVRAVRVADFPSGELVNAENAFYVEGSSLHPCCQMGPEQKDQSGTQYQLSWDRCLPSLIGFREGPAADALIGKFGGHIKRYPQLLAELKEFQQ